MAEENETTESIAEALTASFEEVEKAEADTESVAAPDGIPDEGAVDQEEDKTEALAADDELTSEEDIDEDEEPQTTVFQAPEHWSSDEKEKFESFSPEMQEILLAKDSQYQQGYQEKAEAITAISESIEPWKDELAKRGVTASEAIRTLFAAQHRIDTNPAQGILEIAQTYGVVDQLREYFAPKTDEDDFSDPEITALKTQISELRGKVDSSAQAGVQQNVNRNNQALDNFKAEVDDKGGLKHPHFDKLMGVMAPYVQGGDTLEAAYEKAVWTLPEFRESQVTKKDEKTEADKAAKIKKAKRASRGIKTNGKADTDEGVEAQTLHETLSEAYRQHAT